MPNIPTPEFIGKEYERLLSEHGVHRNEQDSNPNTTTSGINTLERNPALVQTEVILLLCNTYGAQSVAEWLGSFAQKERIAIQSSAFE